MVIRNTLTEDVYMRFINSQVVTLKSKELNSAFIYTTTIARRTLYDMLDLSNTIEGFIRCTIKESTIRSGVA